MSRFAFSALLLGLAACNPTFNWREIRAERMGLHAMFPCKPDTGSRTVPIAGREVELHVLGCDTGGATFAVLSGDVDPLSAGEVLAQWQRATLANLHGAASREQPFVLAGAFFATFGMFLRKWRVVPTRAMIVVSVVSLAILPIYGAVVGFDRMIALGPWENLVQALLQGILAGPGAIYLFTQSVVLLGAGRAAVFPTLVPPCVLLIGWIALGSVPSALQFVGLAIVLLGFRLTQRN